MYRKILDVLPKTDCQRCGRNSCLVFASEIAQKHCCIEACPDITDEAERVVRGIIAAEHEMISWLGGMISGISRNSVKSALALFREVFIVFPARILFLWMFTIPITFPIFLIMLWFAN